MNVIKVKIFFLLLCVGCFYLLAWLLQDQFLLKGDVSWQMHLARVILAGGKYVDDFFEINPPLSIYLYMPAVLLQKKWAVSTIIALRIYVFMCATFSLSICYFLSKRIFLPKDNIVRLLFMFGLFFVYLILPLDEFGQRECLLLYLTMPYFLLVSLRVAQQKIALPLVISIGILAGLGFAIKPFFLLAFGLVEIYYVLNQIKLRQRLLGWLRTETFIILGSLILYVALIIIYHPNYIKIVVPLATHFYYQIFALPLRDVILNPITIYIMALPLFYSFLPTYGQYKKLSNVLIMALVGFSIAYAMQQLPWYYHLLPAFSIALLLYTLLFSLFLIQYHFNRAELLFAWLLGVFVFFYPFLFIKQYYAKSVLIRHTLQPLVTELRTKEENRFVMFFSSNAAYMVSVFEHAGVLPASRLQFLAWMQRYFHRNLSPILSLQQQKDENFFVAILVEDIKKNKPDLIYVDRFPHKTDDDSMMQLDYIKKLTRYPHFRSAWKNYHYQKTIAQDGIYQFDIYSRF